MPCGDLSMKKRGTAWFAITIAAIFLVLWGICNISSLGKVLSAVMGMLSPVIAGFCIAFILNIPLRFYEKIWVKLFTAKYRILRRTVCILLCLLTFGGIVTLIGGLVIPGIVTTVRNDLWVKIPAYIEDIKGWYAVLSGWALKISIQLPPLNISMAGLTSFLGKFVSENGTLIWNQTISIATGAMGFVFDAVVAAVISIYVLAQKETLGRQARKLLYGVLPEKGADRALSLARLTEKTFSSFISGQLTEAAIIGVLCFIGMLIFRIPYALIVSVFVSVTALIPIFGAFIGTGLGAVLILFESPMKAIWFVIFIIILQQIEGNIIYPKVVGSQVGLPGLWVLIAVTVGAEFGIVGMLVAVPIVSLAYTVLGQVVNARIHNKGMDGVFEIPERSKKGIFNFKRKKKKKEETQPADNGNGSEE